MERKQNITYRLSTPLLYLIQQTTSQDTHKIMELVADLAEKMYITGSETFRQRGEKQLCGFWPGTKIFFKLTVLCWSRGMIVKFTMPEKILELTTSEFENCLTEAELLQLGSSPVPEPQIRTPRGMKRMK